MTASLLTRSLLGLAIGLAVCWVALIVTLLILKPGRGRLVEAVRLLPDTLRLLKRLATDPSLERGVRIRLWLVFGLVASPIDFLPEFLPVIGPADDIFFVALVLRSVVRRAGPEAIRRHWPGTDEGLAALWKITRLPGNPDRRPSTAGAGDAPYAAARGSRGGTMGRLDGKVALITGGASGMGMIASKLFAAEGARVMLTDLSDAAGEVVAAEIETAGGEAAYVHADISKEDDARAMVATAVERFGGLHILYNNAGVMLPEDGSVDTTDEEVWDRTLSINVKGVAFGCKYGIPAMIDAGGGSIINVASFVAWLGAATSQTAYTASKGAVLAMTREIAVEYARKGIRCNALCPGPIETPLLMQLLSDEQKRQRRFVHIPMGRLGQAEELAKAALFLASEDSSYMTGASLIVDGGITAAYVTPED